MTLHLIHLPLRLAALHQLAARRGWLSGDTLDEGHALHQVLTEAFGRRALQPFRLMVPPSGGGAAVYAYAGEDAAALTATAATIAAPDLADVIDLPGLRGKTMPAIQAGQRLGFDLRLRPVVRLASPLPGKGPDGGSEGGSGRTAHRRGDEADAFLARVLRQPEGVAAPDREAVYLDWLAGRLRGAALDRPACRLARFARRTVLRGGRAVEGPDAVIHGTLTVTDAAAFAHDLAHGVGRHRAYGYGMMLLRAPQAPPLPC